MGSGRFRCFVARFGWFSKEGRFHIYAACRVYLGWFQTLSLFDVRILLFRVDLSIPIFSVLRNFGLKP